MAADSQGMMPVSEYPALTLILRNVPSQVVEWIFTEISESGATLAVEVTCNSANFDELPGWIERFPSVLVGAGTVLTSDDVRAAQAAGCRFLLSPTLMPADLIAMGHAGDQLVVSGAMTPSEIRAAHLSGSDIVKVFPARSLGAGYARDVQAPLGPTPLMAVGGVTLENAGEFFAGGYDHVGIGTGLFGRPLDQVTRDLVRERLAAAAQLAQ